MKTSEIEKVLVGETNLSSFCLSYKDAKRRLLSRKDGAATSGDLGLVFDSEGFVVTNSQLIKLREMSNYEDICFFANLIALSGFDYDNENTENIIFSLME